jgi:hypothetical protein
MILVILELDAGSGNVLGQFFSNAFGGWEADGNGFGTLTATGPTQPSLGNSYTLFFTYQAPAIVAPYSALLAGTFAGGGLTQILTEGNPNTGNITVYDQWFAYGTSGGDVGATVVFPAPGGGAPQACELSLSTTFVIPIVSGVTFAAEPVTASIPSGSYDTAQTVSLACTSYGVDIHYTTDGSTPTTSSPIYSSAISITSLTTVKAFAHDPSGFFDDGGVSSWTYDIYTGTCTNPANVIDGDDTTFAQLDCQGSTGDVVAVKVNNMNGTTGGPAHIKVDFEVTRNDLVAPSQTLPAWKVSAFIGGTETVLASASPGGGTVARQIVSQSVSAGVTASTLAAKVEAICQIPGSSGALQVKVYAAYLTEP